jgi:uncharacterized membrane protein YccC
VGAQPNLADGRWEETALLGAVRRMSPISIARKWLRTSVRDHKMQFALCLRVTVAALLTLALSQLLNVPLVLWTVLTAVIVTQMSVGRSLKATIDYLVGTLGGAIYSGAVAVLVPHTNEIGLLVALAVAIAPLAFVAAINPSFSVAPFTAVLVLLAPTIIHVSPVESAFYRVLEVALGAITGLGVSYLVFPARTHLLAIDAAARMLDLVVRVLPDLFASFTQARDPQTALRIQNSVGEAFAHLDAIGEEAERERVPYFAAAPDLGPLLRTLLRLRHDLVMIGRAAEAPLPEALRLRLAPLLARVSETVRDYLRASSATLRGRRGPMSLDPVDLALDGYAAEIAALRREGLTRVLPADEVERFFVLSFALEQLHQHFKDLDRCVTECAQSGTGARRKPRNDTRPEQS